MLEYKELLRLAHHAGEGVIEECHQLFDGALLLQKPQPCVCLRTIVQHTWLLAGDVEGVGMAADEELASSLCNAIEGSKAATPTQFPPDWARGATGRGSTSMAVDPPGCTGTSMVTPSPVAPRLEATPLEGAVVVPSPTQGTSKGWWRCPFYMSGPRGASALPEVPAEEDSLQQAVS